MHFTNKNIVLILLSALVIGGAFLLAEYRNKESKKVVYTSPIQAVVNELPSDLQTLDSDGDGLKDWEEVLLGTDSKKSDTDGDGTSDGREASSGRNPLVKGPNDSARSTAKATSTAAALTPTEKLARDFFARYMELNQAGLSGNKINQEDLVKEVLEDGLVYTTPKVYAQKDIIIKNDSSKLALKKYGNDMGLVFKANQFQGKDESIIAKESFDQDNPEILRQIDPAISNYKKIISAFLQVSAPSEVSSIHLQVINSTSQFLFVAESLRAIDSDPLKGVQALKVQPLAVQSLSRSLKEMRNYLISREIEYESTEPGYMFTKPSI